MKMRTSMINLILFFIFFLSTQLVFSQENDEDFFYEETFYPDSATYLHNYGEYFDKRDGKTYKTIKIGTQVWMAENLAFKTDSGCWSYDNHISNIKKYGYLYSLETAKTICPDGFHLPSDNEWEQLAVFADTMNLKRPKSGDDWKLIGAQLKDTTGWLHHGNGPNKYGFSAVPGGGS